MQRAPRQDAVMVVAIPALATDLVALLLLKRLGR
jgi:hypothetical protein